MNTELKNAVLATDRDAQYDNSAKRLIAHKIILARILIKTVEKFKGMDPLEVAALIEGIPYISTVPVELGLTNAVHFQNGKRIVGFNTENQELNEGLVRFDIVFENSSYDDIKCVYSIWICMNMEENTMSHIHLTKEDMIGSYEWKGNLDLLNIIMIGLAKELPEHDETYELHRLLGALLSRELTVDEKLDIIGNEYDIPLEENFRKDMSTMCNLSQGVKEEGIAIGRREGLEEGRREGYAEGEAGLIMTMYKNGLLPEQIASATDKTVEEIKTIIQGKGIFDEI